MPFSSEFDQNLEQPISVSPDSYRLTPEELNEIEAQVVVQAETRSGMTTGVVGVVVKPYDTLANFGRTYEQMTFEETEGYDFAKGMAPYEATSLFLYTVDLDARAIAHTKRLVMALSPQEMAERGLTGLEMIDDRLQAEDPAERATVEQIMEVNGITDLGLCMNIATNETTKRVASTLDRPHVLFSYKAVFDITQKLGITHAIAYLNPVAVRSLNRLGLTSELLGGEEYHLPRLDGGYDKRYKAVCIPGTPENIQAFQTEDPKRPLASVVARQAVPVFYL